MRLVLSSVSHWSVLVSYNPSIVKSLREPFKHDAFSVNITVFNCTLINNIYDMLLTFHDSTSIQLMIKNTIFTSDKIREKSYVIRLHIPPLRNRNSSFCQHDYNSMLVILTAGQ